MSEYILIFVWLALMGVIARFVNVQKTENVLGENTYRFRFGMALLVFLPVIIWTGFRSFSTGGDTYAYVEFYKSLPATFSELFAYVPTVEKDAGFSVLSGVIKIIFGSNVSVYFLILAIIQGISMVAVFRKYSVSYLISVFLFIASTDYISWMFNGIRQFTAITIIFAATVLMLRKKYIPLIIVILLVSTIHGSALLMLPFIFICQGKAWNKKTMLFMIAVLIAVLFVDKFTNILDTFLEDTQYTNVVSDWQQSNDDGTNAFRVLVYAVPTILSVIGIKFIREANNPIINLCTNMSIAATGFYIISMFTSGIYIGRLPMYFVLYGYILLPWEIENMFTRQSAKSLYAALIVFYLAFYYYQLHFVWGTI